MQLKNDVQTISISMNTPNFSNRYLPVSRWLISDEQEKKPGCLGGFMQGMVHTGPQLCGDYTKPLLGDGNFQSFFLNLGVFLGSVFFFLCVKQFGPPGPTVLWILFKQNQRCLKKMENYFDPKKTAVLEPWKLHLNPPVFPTKKPMGLTCAMGTSSEPF